MSPTREEAWHHLRFDPDIAFRARASWAMAALDPQSGDRILDAGCGMGFHLRLLEHLSQSTVVGIELDGARLRAVPTDTRANRVQGDLTHLPFPDGSFDKVLLSEVLEHLPAEHPALRELHRVLKPGGLLVITVPHRRYPFLWDPINWTRERLGLGHFRARPWSGIWTDHQRLYLPGRLVALLRACGFESEAPVAFTRWSIPFAHHLVYEVGQLLVRPDASINQRSSLWGHGPSRPLRFAIRAFTLPDRLNRRSGYRSGSAVSLCVQARRPQSPGEG